MQKRKIKQFEKLLRDSRTVSHTDLEISHEFKQSLRENLYKHYLEEKRGSIMEKFKAFFKSPSYTLFLSLGLVLVVSVAIGGGFFLFGDKSEEVLNREDERILLAGNLAVLEGEVEVMKSNDSNWIIASEGETVNEGDSVKTGDGSRAVLLIDNGNALRLNGNSEIKLADMNPNSVVIEQMAGETYSRVMESEEDTYVVIAQNVKAEALGTVFSVISNVDEKDVAVYVFESNVKVSFEDEEKRIEELNKVNVNTERKDFKVNEVSESEYRSEFIEWNRSEDKDDGFEGQEANKPVVSVTAPESGYETEDAQVTVSGVAQDDTAVRKVKINGTIYEAPKNEDGAYPKEFSFEGAAGLSEGTNTITVEVYDVFWNKGEDVTLTVTQIVPEPDTILVPQPTSSLTVSAEVIEDTKVRVTISMTVDAPQGFKIAWSETNPSPKYPGDSFMHTGGNYTAGSYEYEVDVKKPGTYYLGVSVWEGVGGEPGNLYVSLGPIVVQ